MRIRMRMKYEQKKNFLLARISASSGQNRRLSEKAKARREVEGGQYAQGVLCGLE